MPTVAVFDFLSHEFMHHPFNEAYLRLLRAAFPADRVIFHARPGHIEQLVPRFAPADGIEFRPCPPFAVPFGLSRHHPIAGRLGARRCWNSIVAGIGRENLRLAAVLGVDANLYAVLRRAWPGFAPAPLHMILHNHLAAAMSWRSRNPFYRAFDFLAVLQRPLPPRVRLIALELGIGDAIAAIAPAIAAAVETLEHPVLVSEWAEAPAEDTAPPVLRIGFLGNCSIDKGFGLFAGLAWERHGPALEFHAIGLVAADARALDLSGLIRKPSPTSVPRDEYVAALAQTDLVCLPLSQNYQYVASGSVIDAIAALKPLVC
ncbi:MAG: hypothetical protein P4L83_15195, partial [Nevskia sp.]|nr:hypothetical protein [Nevskia sp.]